MPNAISIKPSVPSTIGALSRLAPDFKTTARQPHQFDVTLRLSLKTPARLDASEVAVEIELQHGRWGIGRTACRLGPHPRKTKPGQIEFFDENIDHSNGVVLAYVIFQAAGQKRALRPFF